MKLSSLAGLTESERQERLRALVEGSKRPPNGELASLEAELRGYESRFGIDSETMRQEVSQGTRSESWEVCRWLMLLAERDRIAGLMTH